jgi:hypothetical protein
VRSVAEANPTSQGRIDVMKKNEGLMPTPRRVMARVLAEDLNVINGGADASDGSGAEGGGFPPVLIPGPKNPTISEAATSEELEGV